MNTFEVYLWLQLDGICTFCAVAGTMLTTISIILLIVSLINKHTYKTSKRNGYNCFVSEKAVYKTCKHLSLITSIGVLFIIMSIFIPTTKQYAIIKVLPQIVNSDIAKQMPDDFKEIYDIAKGALKLMITEQPTQDTSNK